MVEARRINLKKAFHEELQEETSKCEEILKSEYRVLLRMLSNIMETGKMFEWWKNLETHLINNNGKQSQIKT